MLLRPRIDIFTKAAKKLPKVDAYFLFIFHFSRNNYPYLKYWLEHFKSLGVISIPYSEIPEIKKGINKLTKVYSPKNLQEIPKLIFKICRTHKNKKIILVEIGGYSAEISDKLKNVILAVEDTNRGHWQFKENENKLGYPVVSMARTRLKSLENELIGKSITYSIETILRDNFNLDYLVGKKVLVISYGGIGSAAARALSFNKSAVAIYDKNNLKMAQAFVDGFQIASKKNALRAADIVVGCSGHQSLTISDLKNIKDGALLVSGSSRQVEFPYEQMQKYKKSRSDQIESYKVNGKNIYLAYKGQPINFFHDSSLGDVFDLQMALLISCVRFGLVNKLENKIYDIPEEYQDNLVKDFVDKVIE